MRYVHSAEFIFDMMIWNDEILENEYISDGEINGC